MIGAACSAHWLLSGSIAEMRFNAPQAQDDHRFVGKAP
jgi:hypothetical protein